MAAPFDISFDRRTNLLRVTMHGQWSVDDIAAYKDALVALAVDHVRGGGDPSQVNMLFDARDSGVQSQSVVSTFMGSLAGSTKLVRKVVVLTTSALFQMQVKRTGVPVDGIVADEDQAMACFAEPVPIPPAAGA